MMTQGLRAALRAEAEGALAAGDEQPDVAIAQAVLADGFEVAASFPAVMGMMRQMARAESHRRSRCPSSLKTRPL